MAYILESLYAGIAEMLKGTAVGRAGQGNGGGAQGAQDDADDERGGGKLTVPDRGAGADRLERDVHRAGQPGRVRRLDDLVVGGPQGQPRRAGGPGGALEAVQHGAAGNEFLAGGRAGAGGVGRARGGEIGAV